MQHAIDPKIDCVFKALLGAEENRNLLVHFLNAFLAQDLTEPLVSVEILNPYNAQECLTDKLSIVDVKARDTHERLYQIEIQLTSYGSLPARIVYNWADIYSQQLKSGEDYKKLQPTYAIWLLAENLIPNDKRYAHHFKFRDEQGGTLVEHGGIWLLELNKFNAQRVESEEQRWLKFFKEGEELNDEALPDWMATQEMKQAMSILNTFSEKDRQYFQYQARQEFLREQRTIQLELEEARQKEEQARQQQEKARQEFLREQRTIKLELEESRLQEEKAKQEAQASQLREEALKLEAEAAQTEIERLKKLLAQKQA
jgi:predicted transposase/invertase (TIGR01784 family)